MRAARVCTFTKPWMQFMIAGHVMTSGSFVLSVKSKTYGGIFSEDRDNATARTWIKPTGSIMVDERSVTSHFSIMINLVG